MGSKKVKKNKKTWHMAPTGAALVDYTRGMAVERDSADIILHKAYLCLSGHYSLIQ